MSVCNGHATILMLFVSMLGIACSDASTNATWRIYADSSCTTQAASFEICSDALAGCSVAFPGSADDVANSTCKKMSEDSSFKVACVEGQSSGDSALTIYFYASSSDCNGSTEYAYKIESLGAYDHLKVGNCVGGSDASGTARYYKLQYHDLITFEKRSALSSICPNMPATAVGTTTTTVGAGQQTNDTHASSDSNTTDSGQGLVAGAKTMSVFTSLVVALATLVAYFS